jgi:hypothetical protein
LRNIIIYPGWIIVKDQGKIVRTMVSVLDRNVETELEKYRIDTPAVQEIRWRIIGVLDT